VSARLVCFDTAWRPTLGELDEVVAEVRSQGDAQMINNPSFRSHEFSHTDADCPRCERMPLDHTSRHVRPHCPVCAGTLRDPLPWSELFVAGTMFHNAYTGNWK
jgi:hypothetical protein